MTRFTWGIWEITIFEKAFSVQEHLPSSPMQRTIIPLWRPHGLPSPHLLLLLPLSSAALICKPRLSNLQPYLRSWQTHTYAATQMDTRRRVINCITCSGEMCGSSPRRRHDVCQLAKLMMTQTRDWSEQRAGKYWRTASGSLWSHLLKSSSEITMKESTKFGRKPKTRWYGHVPVVSIKDIWYISVHP